MDEEKGHEIAFVQCPQHYENFTRNDLYGSALTIYQQLQLHGADSCGGPTYIGCGCFHRRESLTGRKFSYQYKNSWKTENDQVAERSLDELEEKSKSLTSCAHEETTLRGKEMGLKYGCAVEDVITGFKHVPKDGGRWVWFGLLAAELWFGLYYLLTQALRWNLVFRQPFPDRLSQRYEDRLPKVDIFVCTADPEIEPPAMVVNTVLSMMAYDYPTEKLTVYLSDDAASEVTFYAMLLASDFVKHWVPFCKRFKVEPTSPGAYFRQDYPLTSDASRLKQLGHIKKLYEDMEKRIQNVVKLGQVPEEVRSNHKGFSQWNSYSSLRDHDTILQILLDKKDPNSKDVEGSVLPTLVYLAREKRPQYHHNFKAGAMNALIRVSSKISNGDIILNVDCDMYSNNSQSLRGALCFFMDEEKGHEIAFVQCPQHYENFTRNDLYGSALSIYQQLELHGADSWGGPMYIGSGCFHRRESLMGRKFSYQYKNNWKTENEQVAETSLDELEEKSKALASCASEENTLWGKEMGLKYGCVVEDVITGLTMQCQGWKSVYYNPQRKAFLGVAPNTLPQTLVQHKRWSEGHFQIVLSKYNSAWYGHGRISIGLQMGYLRYNLWAANCLPTLYYSIIPSLYLLKGISLFPQVSSPWFIPFTCVTLVASVYSLYEFLWIGGTIKGWWNYQRIWLYKKSSSYLFGFIDTTLKQIGLSDLSFKITPKVVEEGVSQRFEKEVMEFGDSSPMVTLLATLAMLNLFCFLRVLKDAILSGLGVIQTMIIQVLLCGCYVLISWPLYEGLFLRKDNGRLPSSVAVKSIALALSACVLFIALH
ncbi:hypothetical protein L6164_029520 [Bauhinia variegata]|uniref:Uncharacterized protein n=1 Tax=Bauhinia variegata TaxID=167791 RepID=A0ACB9L9C9_BAUVA|nr:hypothetical protein L6164_029520 [Bauhinia variegata]